MAARKVGAEEGGRPSAGEKGAEEEGIQNEEEEGAEEEVIQTEEEEGAEEEVIQTEEEVIYKLKERDEDTYHKPWLSGQANMTNTIPSKKDLTPAKHYD